MTKAVIVTHWIKHLAHKPDNLSSISRTHIKVEAEE